MSEESGSSSSKKIITLKACDGDLFQVDEDVVMEFETVKHLFDGDLSGDSVIPLPNVSSSTLAKIIKFCKKRIEFRSRCASASASASASAAAAAAATKEIKAFEAEFVNNEGREGLIGLLLAANYLNIKELLEFLYQTVADRIRDMSVEDARDFLGIGVEDDIE